MQLEYLARLSSSVQQFVHQVEAGAGLDITVTLEPGRNGGGTTGLGKLAVVIEFDRIELFAPTNGYFPDGAVRHELLHVQRFLVEGVPKLALAEDEPWDKRYADALGEIDNAIEHVLIVPMELRLHPERRSHWGAVMAAVCAGLVSTPEEERPLAIALHWTFLREILAGSPLVPFMRDYAAKHGLMKMADQFADRFCAASASKEELVRLLYATFPVLPRKRAALEYLHGGSGTSQKPIP